MATGAREGVAGTMANDSIPVVCKELSPETWRDFEALFSRGNGWDFCACMVYQRGSHLSRKHFPTRADQQRQNQQEKKQLVEQDRSHGIVVYADDEPVGWCQYGPREEIPLAGRSSMRGWARAVADSPAQWRITCFVVDKRYRGRGIAAAALRAALDAIRAKGGGLVEAYPFVVATPSWGHAGSISMFEREGFEHAGPFDKNHVVMRRTV